MLNAHITKIQTVRITQHNILYEIPIHCHDLWIESTALELAPPCTLIAGSTSLCGSQGRDYSLRRRLCLLGQLQTILATQVLKTCGKTKNHVEKVVKTQLYWLYRSCIFVTSRLCGGVVVTDRLPRDPQGALLVNLDTLDRSVVARTVFSDQDIRHSPWSIRRKVPQPWSRTRRVL